MVLIERLLIKFNVMLAIQMLLSKVLFKRRYGVGTPQVAENTLSFVI